MFPGGCGPATLEHFEKSKMAANYEKILLYWYEFYIMLKKKFDDSNRCAFLE